MSPAEIAEMRRWALEIPATWDAHREGYRAQQPQQRKIEVHVPPGGVKLPIGTPGRLKARSMHWQFSTILTVDMETPRPLWHARVAWLDVGADRPRPLVTWEEWQIERAMIRLVNLLRPGRDDFEERAQLDKQRASLHMRLPVTEMEKSMLIAAELGPVLH